MWAIEEVECQAACDYKCPSEICETDSHYKLQMKMIMFFQVKIIMYKCDRDLLPFSSGVALMRFHDCLVT